MAKAVHDDVLDAALNVIKSTVTRQVACSAQPTTYAQANATYALASVTMTNGDFTIANGDSSGRKLTVAAKSGALIGVSGTATHVALLDVANNRLLQVTTCASLALTANGSNTVGFPSWKVELGDPT